MAERADSHDKKSWAFFVYLAGDNNLSEEMVWSLQEMKSAASRSEVRERLDLAALFDPSGGPPRRYDFVTPRKSSLKSGEPRLASFAKPSPYEGEDASKLLEKFLRTAIDELSPSKHRAVILSGHGSGAVGDFLDDLNPRSSLSIPRLGKILLEVGRKLGAGIDILGLDSCQMSTVEVGYEVRHSVRYLVASEGPVANTGWPYRQVLEAVADDSEPGSTARAIADRYLEFYRDYEVAGLSTDIAVCDLSAIEPVVESLRRLASTLTASLSLLAPDGLEEEIELGELASSDSMAGPRAVRDALVLAHWSSQSYKCDRYLDLYDFTRQLLRFSSSIEDRLAKPLRESGLGLLDAIEGAVIRSGATGADLQHSHGLSIYFPWASRDYFAEYRNLRFAGDTGWGEFLQVYLDATRRARRFQRAHLKTTDGSRSVAEEPLIAPEVEPFEVRDLEAGTRRDLEAGTRRGKACRSTMKNPPKGYYSSS